MLTTYLKRQTTLTTYYTSSAGPYLDEFTEWLAQCGFHDKVICQYLPGVNEFAAWVDATYGNLASLPVNALTHFHDYLATCGRLRYLKGQHSIHWLGAQHFVEFLQSQKKIVVAEILPKMTQPELLRQFELWMQTHRGVRPSTLCNYRQHIVELLSTLGEHPEQFTADALHTFILNYALGRSHALAKKRVTAVRMFFDF